MFRRSVEVPLSPFQRLIWAEQRVAADRAIANIAIFAIIDAEGDEVSLLEAVRLAVAESDAFRSRVHARGQAVVLEIVDHAELRSEVVDLRAHEAPLARARADAERRAGTAMPLFDCPLVEMVLYRTGPRQTVLYLAVHHLIGDATSMLVLSRRAIAHYERLIGFATEVTGRVIGSYQEWAARQDAYLASPIAARLLDSAVDQLRSVPEGGLLGMHPRGRESAGIRVTRHLDEPTTRALRSLLHGLGCSPNTFMTSVFGATLTRLTGVTSPVIGNFVHNRHAREDLFVAGLLVNVVLVRVPVRAEATMEAHLRTTNAATLGALRASRVPLATVLTRLGHNAPFDTAVSFQPQTYATTLAGKEMVIDWLWNGHSSYALQAHVSDRQSEGRLRLELDFRQEVFPPETPTELADSVCDVIARAVSSGFRCTLRDLGLVSVAQGKRLAQTRGHFLPLEGASVPSRIQRLAVEQPDRAAVRVMGTTFSYAEIAARAEALARELRGAGVVDGDVVALALDRDLTLIVAPLAVMLAGAAYLPLDTSSPDERLRELLDEARPVLTLCSASEAARFASLPGKSLVCTGERVAPTAGREHFPAALPSLTDRSLAYLIFTSGSTGRPKAVRVDHGNLENFVVAVSAVVPLADAMRVACTTTIAFDIFALETWAALCNGREVVIVGDDARDPAILAARLIEGRCDFVQLTPTRVEMLLRNDRGRSALATLSVLLLGGEPLPPALLRDLQQVTRARVFNMYGPTETTVWSTVADVTASETVTIGRAIGNTDLTIVDRYGDPLPPGFLGELCIGGSGVTQGYEGQSELTATRFVPHPGGGFSSRMYRTGDVARMTGDGEVVHHGRLDHQVKLRGFRVELGEIEAKLTANEWIAAACVVVHKTGRYETLAAFVVRAEASVALGTETLLDHLRQKLPSYMVPSVVIELSALPLLPSGKVDRKQLERRSLPANDRASTEVPANELERRLLEVMREVMEAADIGVTDDFFERGGHSLQAVAFTEAASRILEAPFSLEALYRHRTVRALAEVLGSASGAAPRFATPSETIEEAEPTPSQLAMILATERDGDDGSYHMTGGLVVDRPLPRQELEAALQRIIERHPVLTARFLLTDAGMRMQRRRGVVPALRDLGHVATPAEAGALLREPFDTANAPWVHFGFARTASHGTVVAVDMHHALGDARSLGILFEDLCALLCDRPLAPAGLSFFEVAQAEQRRLASAESAAEIARRVDASSGEAPFEGLADLVERGEVTDHAPTFVVAPLRAGAVLGLAEAARRARTTPFAVALAGVAASIARHGATKRVVLGTPVSLRSRMELAHVVGPLVTFVPIAVAIEEHVPVDRFLAQTGAAVAHALAASDLPHEAVALAARRPAPTNVMFLFDEEPAPFDLDGMKVTPWELAPARAKIDLTVRIVVGRDGSARLECIGRAGVWPLTTLNAFVARTKRVLDTLSDGFEGSTADLPVLTASDNIWLTRYGDRPEKGAVLSVLETLARAPADAIAAVDESGSVTYASLRRRAAMLARVLVDERGVERETRVVVLAQPSIEMLVAILAALLAGGAYVPLDPAYPDQRITELTRDSGAVVVLAGRSEIERAERLFEGNAVAVSSYTDDETSDAAPVRFALEPLPSSLAYVVYTSGTTGTPKGVMIEHRQLDAQAAWLGRFFSDLPPLRHVFLISPAVDVSVHQVFLPLLRGDALYFPTRDTVLDPALLRRYVEAHRIDVVDSVPSFIREFLLASDHPLSLVVLSTGGDVLTKDILELAATRARVRRFVNYYGPTEACLNTTAWKSEAWSRVDEIPIGEPVDGYRVLVVDDELRQVPPGVVGEIAIAGAGTARGYDDLPAVTAAAFVPTPDGAGRMYRTGDRGRWRDDGALVFAGRSDRQVKIRGYRVELGEVERVLASAPSIAQAVVGVRERAAASKTLVAYVVSADGGAIDEPALRTMMSARLPAHMRPDVFVGLAKMPLTVQGKIDHAALADVALPTGRRATTSSPALTATAKIVVEELSRLLGVNDVDATQSFFDVGGDSLMAMRLLARLRTRTGVEVSVRTLFESASLLDLAAKVGVAGETPPAVEVLADAATTADLTYPVTHAQRRMMVLDALSGDTPLYNIAGYIEIRGPLQESVLAAALRDVAQRHEAFRTSFQMENGLLVALVAGEGAIPLQAADLRGRSNTEVEETLGEVARRPFSIDNAPLARAGIFRIDDDTFAFALSMHHLVSDGWSLRILVEELSARYATLSAGTTDRLPNAPPFSNYAHWAASADRSETRAKNLELFVARTAGIAALELPTDRRRREQNGVGGSAEVFEVPASARLALRELGRSLGVTEFSTVLAAVAATVMRFTGRRQFIIGTPTANREGPASAGAVGCFVNTVPLVMNVSRDTTFEHLLRQVSKETLEALDHQDYAFEELVARVDGARDLRRPAVVQMMYTFDDSPETELEMAGLHFTPRSVPTTTSKFDLSVDAAPSASGGLRLTLEYATDLFDATTIVRFGEHLVETLRVMVVDPSARVTRSPRVPASHGAIAEEAHEPATAQPAPLVLAQLEHFATVTPDRPLFVSRETSLSYAAVWRLVRGTADDLRRRGLVPGERVGVLVTRRIDALVAFLSILAAGGAYVPLDPAYPIERLGHALRVCEARFVFASDEAPTHGPFEALTALVLSQGTGDEPANPPIHPEQAAYVIFTSGTTGEPKGVVISHFALATWSAATASRYAIGPRDRSAVVASLAFDGSVWDVYPFILVGASVAVPLDDDLASGGAYAALVRDLGVTCCGLSTAFWSQLTREMADGLKLPDGVRIMTVGGEAMPTATAVTFLDLVKGTGVELTNQYGPTEITVVATGANLSRLPWRERGEMPIGKAWPNARVYVLDTELDHVPVGVTGDLWIGGPSLSNGYEKDPHLTASRFLPDPFSERPGRRMYRTGDKGRLRPSGVFEILGRDDDQVKFRGYRVHLGEVERVLAQHPAVREAVVLVIGRGGLERLVAYVTGACDGDSVRAFARTLLPSFMIPSAVVVLAKMPVTAVGKIDRRAMPAPPEPTIEALRMPETEDERVLAELWKDVLGLTAVGRDSHFFDLGGQSILAMQLVTRVETTTGKKLALRALYENPTLEALARVFGSEEERAEPTKTITRVDRSAGRRKRPGGS